MIRIFWAVWICLTIGQPAGATQTTALGEISGRITQDAGPTVGGAGLAGVRVSAASGDEHREAVTNGEGAFTFGALPFKTYQIKVELAGFGPLSGTVVLSLDKPRAHLAWSLEAGCIEEDVRIDLPVRQAALTADLIAYIAVDQAGEAVQWSPRPACGAFLARDYVARTLELATGRNWLTLMDLNLFPILENVPGSDYRVGSRYVVLLRWNSRLRRFRSLGDHLVLPVREGLVVAPGTPLDRMGVAEAVELLRQWAGQP